VAAVIDRTPTTPDNAKRFHSGGRAVIEPGDESSARSAKDAVYRLENQLRKAEKRADRLVLVIHALFRLLAEKTGATEAELQDALAGIGKEAQTRAPVECPGCGRVFNTAAQKCMYCGESRPLQSIFDAL
jgi:hypothetical protein